MLVAQSCLTVCDLMNCNPAGSSAHGILQARMLEWVTIPFSRGSSWPTDQTQLSCICPPLFQSHWDLVALRYAIFPLLYQYLLWVPAEWSNVHENIQSSLPYWALLLGQCPWTLTPWSKGELQLFNKPLRWPSCLHNHIGSPISAHGRVDNYWNSSPCFLCAFVTGLSSNL